MTPPEENDLAAFAAELAALRPRADRLDRVRLAYLAGQASVRVTLPSPAPVSPARRWAWPVSFAAMTATAAVFGVMLLRSPGPLSAIPSERNQADRNTVEQIANQPVAQETPLESTAAKPGHLPALPLSRPNDYRLLRTGMTLQEIDRELARPWRPIVSHKIDDDPPPAWAQPQRHSILVRSIDDVL